jgi:NAD+ synthase (glutamine-hydrolysing)
LAADRLRMSSFTERRTPTPAYRRISFTLNRPAETPRLLRAIEPHPFAPDQPRERHERCEEIFQIQLAGLAGRLEFVQPATVSIGVSGGLDSTLALLVTCKTFDLLHRPRSSIRAFTLPGFGTTGRTLANARALMSQLGVSATEIDIRSLCLEEMRALGHQPFGLSLEGQTVETLTEQLRHLPAERRHDLTFENIQARRRTALLMNAGFVVGTGDLSELALGWCTYNADHMSMYNPNASVPKTLVKYLVDYAARHEFDGPARATLLDIVATEISPELLPADADGRIAQTTESTVGPYELVDFFLYEMLRYGFGPAKILYLAEHARFDVAYSRPELVHWLGVFLRRFFGSQFKRSCLPDGPKVGSVSLSPRGDWRMSTDASAAAWLAELEAVLGEDSRRQTAERRRP